MRKETLFEWESWKQMEELLEKPTGLWWRRYLIDQTRVTISRRRNDHNLIFSIPSFHFQVVMVILSQIHI